MHENMILCFNIIIIIQIHDKISIQMTRHQGQFLQLKKHRLKWKLLEQIFFYQIDLIQQIIKRLKISVDMYIDIHYSLIENLSKFNYNIYSCYYMTKIYNWIGHFLIGLMDSISLRWISGVLFYTDPKTHKILKESIELQKTLGRSILQAGIITTLIPLIIRYFGFQILYLIATGLSLIFTYTYLIFYNMELTENVHKIIVYKTKQNPEQMPQLDMRIRYNILDDLSNQIQSFIFQMVYYTPMNILVIIITLFDETYFPVLLVIMDSFFNTAFYYFRKWPYDKYNVAFLQKHLAYSLGYGFFVSIVTNVMLPSTMSIGGYLLISQMMIINAFCHTPPEIQFKSLGQIFAVLRKRSQRRKLKSAYNIHRKLLSKDKQYTKNLLKDCVLMKSFFILTEKINRYLNEKILKKPISATIITQNPADPHPQTTAIPQKQNDKLKQQVSDKYKQNNPIAEQNQQQISNYHIIQPENTSHIQLIQLQEQDQKQRQKIQ